MSEALLVWLSAGIVFFIGAVNAVLMVYTWTLLKAIRKLLEGNIYLNREALDLMHYGVNRGYERGLDDALKELAERSKS